MSQPEQALWSWIGSPVSLPLNHEAAREIIGRLVSLTARGVMIEVVSSGGKPEARQEIVFSPWHAVWSLAQEKEPR